MPSDSFGIGRNGRDPRNVSLVSRTLHAARSYGNSKYTLSQIVQPVLCERLVEASTAPRRRPLASEPACHRYRRPLSRPARAEPCLDATHDTKGYVQLSDWFWVIDTDL